MPSIPQSLLWISLVVLWLFVLVPMLISKRDAVRRTSDVALATRVLNTGAGARLLRRGTTCGRASQRSGLAAVRRRSRRRPSTRNSTTNRRNARWCARPPSRPTIDSEPDYLDVDVVDEDSGALPSASRDRRSGAESRGSNRRAAIGFRRSDEADEATEVAETDEPEDEYEPDGTDDEYEYVADSSGWRRRRTPTCSWPTR